MRRRPMALVLTAALIGAVFTALPAHAATEVPAVVQIEDPVGDANTFSGDVVGPDNRDASSVGDILKVWFTNDPEKISVHFMTEAPPPASANGVLFQVYANPDADGAECLEFYALIPGANAGGTYQGAPLAKLLDVCNDGTSFYGSGAEGELLIEELEDGSGLTTMTFPRNYSSLLADGSGISAPWARTDLVVGTDAEGFGFTSFRLDDTKVGTDYTIASGDGAEPPVIEEPKPPKAPKNPCKKLKGKKKKKCIKKHAAKPCAAYQPGELGAEAETAIVTDAANADAPVEVTLAAEPGLGVGGTAETETAITHVYHNVQVDPAAAETGLYVRLEMPAEEDYDLFLRREDGSEAARAAGFNPEPEVFNDTEGGGHTENGAEVLEGIKTNDCGGYTIDVGTASGFGGDLTVKLWLGDVIYDPDAASAAAATVF